MFHWSSNFLILFVAIEFLPISSETPVHDSLCYSTWYLCNSVNIARDCNSVEWCERQAAVCDTIPIFQKSSVAYFGDMLEDLAVRCQSRYMAFKKPGVDLTELPGDNSD